jgi:hypothetical protein
VKRPQRSTKSNAPTCTELADKHQGPKEGPRTSRRQRKKSSGDKSKKCRTIGIFFFELDTIWISQIRSTLRNLSRHWERRPNCSQEQPTPATNDHWQPIPAGSQQFPVPLVDFWQQGRIPDGAAVKLQRGWHNSMQTGTGATNSATRRMRPWTGVGERESQMETRASESGGARRRTGWGRRKTGNVDGKKTATTAREIGSETSRVARAKTYSSDTMLGIATYIIRGPMATYIVHVQDANMQETP